MKKPAISVIVLNWNGRKMLKECLDSLSVQTFRDFEVIMVDNGSTDGSADFVSEKFPEVRLVSLDRNYGFCGGNNRGFSHARGDFWALLNNDAIADSKWLEELYKGILSSGNVGFCASKILFSDREKVIDSAGDGFGVCGVGFKRGHSMTSEHFEKQEEVFGACGAGVIYRKALLEEIGFFDEDLFLIHEDVDLSFRARLRGHKCLFIPTAIIYHRCNSSLGFLSDTYVYFGHRNAEIVYLKNMPSKLILKYFHHHILYNFLALIYFIFKGKGGIFLKAKFHFFKMLPKVLKKRKIIQVAMTTEVKKIDALLEKKWLVSRKGGKW